MTPKVSKIDPSVSKMVPRSSQTTIKTHKKDTKSSKTDRKFFSATKRSISTKEIFVNKRAHMWQNTEVVQLRLSNANRNSKFCLKKYVRTNVKKYKITLKVTSFSLYYNLTQIHKP